MKLFVAVVLSVLVLAGCGDDDSGDDAGSAQERLCQQYEDLGAEPSDADLDALVATAEESGDADLVDEVTAAVAELKAGDDGGPAAEALATTCF